MKIYDYKGRKNLCGNRVKEARARLKITQEDLAARLQVGRWRESQWSGTA